jgi:hypothetical protein
MTGRNEGLRHTGRNEGLQSLRTTDARAYDPVREAQAGGLQPEQIRSAEWKLAKLDDSTLQRQKERGERWLNENSSQRGTDKYQQQQKALELIG